MNVHSLPVKINTAIITTALVISVLFFIILYPMDRNRRTDQIQRIHLLLDTVFQQKNNDLANELFAGQTRALLATLKSIQAVNGVSGVSIYNEAGQLFLSTNNKLNNAVLKQNTLELKTKSFFSTTHVNNNYFGIYSNRIEVISKKIGHIVIFYDLAKLEKDSRNAMIVIFILPILTTLLMAGLLNLFLFDSIIHPVSRLRAAMERVATGTLGEQIPLPGKDEIGEMGSAFNDMSMKLYTSHKALIKAEEKYRSIFENAIEGIFQYSPEKQIFITVNSSMADILLYDSPQELINITKSTHKHFFTKKTDRIKFNTTLQKLGKIIDFETKLYTKHKSSIWVSISARRVFDENKIVLYDEGSFVDITERLQRKKAERERKIAQAASRAKSRFIAKMSHEIRTPLNAILGFADILENSLTHDTQKENINIIKSSGVNLLDLVNDILDLSKIEAGQMQIKQSKVNLRLLIEELINLFSVTVRQKGIALMAKISSDIPEFLLLDRIHLRQILFNLIGNAVKFTDIGHVKIRATAKATDTPNLWDLTISVKDTGPGIENDAHQIIFKYFHQHYNRQFQAKEGTGLGLAISRDLAEMMNGKIQVDSEPGKGSVFTLVLPGIMALSGTDKGISKTADQFNPKINKLFAPATLLVVDDLKINRQLIMTIIKNMPFKILETDNGESAVSMATFLQPDLILMDIMMPDMNGYETLKQIRQNKICTMPIIAITAAGMKEDIINIKYAGFNDYLIRPFSPAQFLEKLGMFLKSETMKSPVDFISIPEDIQLPIKPYSQTWDCPAQPASLLQTHYMEVWEKICNLQRIPDITLFSEEICLLGEEHGIKALVSYSQTLLCYTKTIDIDNLQNSLKEFPIMLNNMKII
ncbi:MAG: ATP-binding protein [Pseudomonadota bacterium]